MSDNERPTASNESPKKDHVPVVGVGASAGGLRVLRKFIEELPAETGMAFIIIQHLDPSHESMMVELLSGHTTMPVQAAADGMALAPDNIYAIPPGVYLSIRDGALRLSEPQEPRGARLPFDFLLHSLAEMGGERAMCVILSGSGADGALGLKAIKEHGGLVIAQDPDEAEFDGMPRSAIATRVVDAVLPVARIPEALVAYNQRMQSPAAERPREDSGTVHADIVELLLKATGHDFALYKPGTLQRRIDRRMAMGSIASDRVDLYIERLRDDPDELNQLARDMLIHVTRFFRDPSVFDRLATKDIPALLRHCADGGAVRIWVAGCSTGEETYSLAMLFQEAIAAERRDVKLQIFASDVDPDAVAIAREGVYPESIAAEVSAERLATHFTREDHSYRVLPKLRQSVVFTVQDALSDPPFSRLDMISCRNLLIYLQPEAQAKLVSTFHFALRDGGLLLLGGSEAIGPEDGRFEALSKVDRLFRRQGPTGYAGSFAAAADTEKAAARAGPATQRQKSENGHAELCRRLVLEAHAPASVLINRHNEYLYSVGPTDRYLGVTAGHPTRDVFALARDAVRGRLRTAVERAGQERRQIAVTGGRLGDAPGAPGFGIEVRPVSSNGEELLLITFLEEEAPQPAADSAAGSTDDARVAQLEQELDTTQRELADASRNYEMAAEAQRGINDELLSVNEEYQATNEELLTSKEELQSMNEELTAMNSQLQEVLAKQRALANDLENILNSADIATLFLDTDLNIRFFTPRIKALFRLIQGDVGRPLEDMKSLAADLELLPDARKVLDDPAPIEREVEAAEGTWFTRRIQPYRVQDGGVEGVVITYVDTTAQRRAAEALAEARRQAELATIAKSRFLAAASHDLRQPMQTLILIQSMLAGTAQDEQAQGYVARIGEILKSMSGMLNALLDINQIDAGVVQADPEHFSAARLLERLRDEFGYIAEAGRIELRVVSSDVMIVSDPRLLEQMIRNLLSNALKYTQHGKVLLGCRRRGGKLSIEVWDTGPGIPEAELQPIFEEYHRADDGPAGIRGGLGLGLSIVRRLADLMGHEVEVRSRVGKGSVFGITVPVAKDGPAARQAVVEAAAEAADDSSASGASVLIVEDDVDVNDLLALLLRQEGYRVDTAVDGKTALRAVTDGGVRPDAVLCDFGLPGETDGLQVIAAIRHELRQAVPCIVLTGDISLGTLRAIAGAGCTHLPKPAIPSDLMRELRRLLTSAAPGFRAATESPAGTDADGGKAMIHVVDDDGQVRDGLRDVLENKGWAVTTHASGEDFLAAESGGAACLLLDAYLPGLSGIDVLQQLRERGDAIPVIVITGRGDVTLAVDAMKHGALDFLEKPIEPELLTASIRHAIEARQHGGMDARRQAAAGRLARLTPRQYEVLALVIAGRASKIIAHELDISQRTVEHHRAEIMKKAGVKSIPELTRLYVAATWADPEE